MIQWGQFRRQADVYDTICDICVVDKHMSTTQFMIFVS